MTSMHKTDTALNPTENAMSNPRKKKNTIENSLEKLRRELATEEQSRAIRKIHGSELDLRDAQIKWVEETSEGKRCLDMHVRAIGDDEWLRWEDLPEETLLALIKKCPSPF